MTKHVAVEQTIRFLVSSFEKRAKLLGTDNRKGTELYRVQVEMCYIIDQIQRGGDFKTYVTKANTLIDGIVG